MSSLSTPTVAGDQSWHASAVCAQTDPELFFPESGQNSGTAKAVCHSCPVSAECLAEALARGERFGVWGGLSARDRRPLRRQHQQAAIERWADSIGGDR
ncbi:WhiB family transcriptional regulator [Saccharomonospora piscinae]|uniref:WhiB family transcriptional regulator n=1 Tax=Saccharomonospora piscinae TaxID=687388 RepID=UPI001FC90188|nr:WhiB family transcriptional regulator [Saccharomonospora piscinae]